MPDLDSGRRSQPQSCSGLVKHIRQGKWKIAPVGADGAPDGSPYVGLIVRSGKAPREIAQ
jgi:hypothetical protein